MPVPNLKAFVKKHSKPPLDPSKDHEDDDAEDEKPKKSAPPPPKGKKRKINLDKAANDAEDHKDDEVDGHLEGYDAERDGNPPQWVTSESTWEKAKKAVKPKWDSYDEPYAVVAYVYKQMGGTFKKKAGGDGD